VKKAQAANGQKVHVLVQTEKLPWGPLKIHNSFFSSILPQHSELSADLITHCCFFISTDFNIKGNAGSNESSFRNYNV